MSFPLPIRWFKYLREPGQYSRVFLHGVAFTADFGSFKKDEVIAYVYVDFDTGNMYESNLEGEITGRVQEFKCTPCIAEGV